jgi:transcriptional regulator with XRE-family HTH domain
MNQDEQPFFKALGARIAELRKEQGLTQQQLAERLEIAQQTLAHYEVGRLRMPVSLLPEFSHLFGVPVDELLGLSNGAGKRGPTPKFQKQLERISRLPRAKQHVVMEMLDGVLQQASR